MLISLFRDYVQKIYWEEIVAIVLSDGMSDDSFLKFLVLFTFSIEF